MLSITLAIIGVILIIWVMYEIIQWKSHSLK